ncbi:PREDICTED: centromere protein U isoform X2 [Calidris pugnax]|uniref:centromere protein U isoform X2 n=1 Tax=Calidris pugnax TaxID=198806 RepID=UPI00071D4D68|nr:PREDICTED: centromere protein U isoform X2 [Calidris pugnax]
MSSKKKRKRSHSRSKLKEHEASSRSRWKLLMPEEPDVSRILKVAEANQLEELDDSFDHPLHSTAVGAYGEEQSQHEQLGRVSALQRKKAERSKSLHHSKTSGGDTQKRSAADPEPLKENTALNTAQTPAKKKQRPLEARSEDRSSEDKSSEDRSSENKSSEDRSSEDKSSEDKSSEDRSSEDKSSEDKSSENTADPSVTSSCSVEVWCPKELKRSSRDITELDVVLAEFEKIAANYRQRIESNVGRKAINGFCSAFKDQITDLIREIQGLKNMKKKNAKVITDIKKKRQRLLQLREEQIGAERQLMQLQRECAELQERKSSLRQATELLTDLKDLQQDCLNYREENPKQKVVYGTASLPALLVESRGILGAERHFQNINKKLEKALAAQRGKSPEKH